jgi:hypothetical protein
VPTFNKSVATQSARKPPGFVVLEPAHWKSDYPNAPRSAVAVGVFPISENDLQVAMAEAAKDARLYYPEADEDDELLTKHFNETLISLAVARAICQPNDVEAPYFPQPDDQVREAWLPATIRRIWDELETVTIATSPIMAAASDEDLERLAALMSKGLVSKMASAGQLRARKLLKFCLEELEAVDALFSDDESVGGTPVGG